MIKKIIKLIDILFAFVILIISAVLLIPYIILGRIFVIFNVRKYYKNHRILSLPSCSYMDSINKGLSEWHTGSISTHFSYFEKHWLISLISKKYSKYILDENIIFYDLPTLFKEKINKTGFKFTILSINELFILFTVSTFIFVKKIDVIRSGSPYFIGINTVLLYFITGCPYYFNVGCDFTLDMKLNGLPKHIPSERIAYLLIKICFRYAARILTIRHYLKEHVVSLGAKPEKTVVIYVGVYLEPLLKEDKELIDDNYKDTFNVVYAARINRVNVIKDIVYCGEKIVDRIPNIKFIILGGCQGPDDENYYNECISRIKEKGLENNFFMPGKFYNNSEVLKYYKHSNVNLIPMGGYSLIEAAASGNPVITYDIDWHTELIEDQVSGVVVKYGDSSGLADAVYTLYKNRDAGERMAAEAKKTVMERHTFENYSKNIIKMFESIYKEQYNL